MPGRLPFFLAIVFVLVGLPYVASACDGEREGHPAAGYQSFNTEQVPFQEPEPVSVLNHGTPTPADPQPTPSPTLQFTPAPVRAPEYMTVTGPGDDVAAFVIRYQDAMWPEWRFNARVAREMARNIRQSRRLGRAVLWTGDETGRRAFDRARVTAPVPGIDD